MMVKTVAGAAILGAFVLAAQQDFSKVEIKVEQLSEHVYMLSGAGGNIAASVGDDGTLIVDSQFAPLVPKIEAALKEIADERVRFLINTHWHGDHTGGNEGFARLSAEIIAHQNARKRLAAGASNRFGTFPPAPAEALPIITFDRSLSVHFNGEEVRALHVPNGHTDGDSVIFFTGSKVVHMGDDFVNGAFPFIDLDSGGGIAGLIAGVESVLAELRDDVKIIPGHGPLATKADLQQFLTMLRETSAAVSAALAQGKTIEQMKQEKVLAKWDRFGQSFIKTDAFTEILYRSLQSSGTAPKNDHGHGR